MSCQRSFRLDKRKISSLKSGKPLEQRSSRVTIPQSVQKMSRCATLPYGLGCVVVFVQRLDFDQPFGRSSPTLRIPWFYHSISRQFSLDTIYPRAIQQLHQVRTAVVPSLLMVTKLPTGSRNQAGSSLRQKLMSTSTIRLEIHGSQRTHAWPQSYFHQKYFDLQWVPWSWDNFPTKAAVTPPKKHKLKIEKDCFLFFFLKLSPIWILSLG